MDGTPPMLPDPWPRFQSLPSTAKACFGLNLDQAWSSLMRGPGASEITVTVVREDGP